MQTISSPRIDPNGPSASPRQQHGRNRFVDAYRGYALLAITLNHFAIVAGDEGVAGMRSFTLTPLGLSSGAEIFMLCSGFAFLLAYRRVLDSRGLRPCVAKATRRAVQLLCCNLVMTLLSAGAIALVVPTAFHAAGSFDLVRYVFHRFGAVLRMMASFQWTAAYHDVLPLYALLLLVGPFMLLALRRAPLLAAGLSAGVWLLAVTGLVTPADIGLPTWYFHPLAWQFMFFLGMAVAQTGVLEPLARHPATLPACLVLLAAALVYKFVAYKFPTLQGVSDGVEQAVPFAAKLTLGPLRILHAMVLAVCAASLYARAPAAFRDKADTWLGKLGRVALPVFVASNPIMYLHAGVLATWPSQTMFYALYVSLALSLSGAASVWARYVGWIGTLAAQRRGAALATGD